MKSFVWNSRASKTNLLWHKADHCLPKVGVGGIMTIKGTRGDGNILHLDCSDGYMGIYL